MCVLRQAVAKLTTAKNMRRVLGGAIVDNDEGTAASVIINSSRRVRCTRGHEWAEGRIAPSQFSVYIGATWFCAKCLEEALIRLGVGTVERGGQE